MGGLETTLFGKEVIVSDKVAKVRIEICTNFMTLQKHIIELDEDQLLQCILVEKEIGFNRMNIQNRLYSRYSRLRAERERREMYV